MKPQIPDQINYERVKPVGWYSKFKQWPVEPYSTNNVYQPNQIVRFQFQLTNGLFDPYRSHLTYTLSTPTAAQMPVGGIQLDNSAQSIISTMVLSSKHSQIERILQYDTLAAYLTDIGFSQSVCQNRQAQGLGFYNYQVKPLHNQAIYNTSNRVNAVDGGVSQTWIQQNVGGGGLSPTKTLSTVQSSYILEGQTSTVDGVSGGAQTLNTPAHVTSSNFIQFPSNLVGTTPATPQGVLDRTGFLLNMRAQYQPNNALKNSIDSTSSFRTNMYNLPVGTIPANTWATGSGIPSTHTYSPYVPQALNTLIKGQGNKFYTLPNISPIYGFERPYNPKFGVGGGQPMLSPTIPQCQFGYGLPSSKPVPISRKKFQIALISSVMGTLIPCDQYRLLPLKAFYDTLLQLTLNPYAVFTTGYKDVHQLDSTGMQTAIKRDFLVSRMYYNLHIYQWPQQYLANYIQDSLTKQIFINGCSWALSGQYQIPSGQSVSSNTWQITTGAQSLSQVVALFISNQYIKYPFCRKQFRLSNNVRSMQIKFDTQYFPPQPIVGNAGNPQDFDGTGDNYSFFEKLLVANNYKFSTNVHPRINPYNFAINGRPYDTTRQDTFYQSTMNNNTTYVWSANSVNSDTAMGMPSWHQNRYIGRCAYVFPFQPYGHSKNVMVGINTKQSRPMELQFDTYTTNYFPYDQNLYIFTRANTLVIYSQNGITVRGR